MANCISYDLICPIGATGGECRWSISCCDGSFQRVILQEGEISTPCIDKDSTFYNGEPVAQNSISGTFTPVDVPCTSACGTVNPAPNPTPPSPPTPPTPPSPPTPAPTPAPDYCLGAENEVTIQNISGSNKYVFGGNYGTYGTNVGTYVLKNVPAAHPIAIQNYNLTGSITYTGTNAVGPKVGLDGNTYTYYWGDVTITVLGFYGTISYECYYHGYMGGQNNLIYNSTTCSVPSPTPPAPTPPTPPTPSTVPPVPSPVTTEYTLTYAGSVKGWPSFYSYIPEYMMGMNNYLYSFNGGNLYKHNTNEVRNNFYGQQYDSQITSVFNQNPLENKIFKTINLESDSAWTVNSKTDIQDEGYVDYRWFEKKEGAYFAYLRKTNQIPAPDNEFALRSANGIGKTSGWNLQSNVLTVNFSVNPLVSIGDIVSIGDYLYFSEPQYTTVKFAGQITNIEVDLRSGINRLFANTNITGAQTIGVTDPYMLYIKNIEAEVNGMLGHQLNFTLTNPSTTSVELFAVEAEVMKSYP
jgi:hypothetical protein